MRYSVTMFMTDETMRPVEFARAVEERGLHGIYIPEHTHIPVSRLTPPPTGDAELPVEYRRTLDPFVALALMAAVTERIVLGTGILLPAQRDPLVTAKAVATLDRESNGRVVLGIGFGWNRDEIEQHGIAFADRRDICREHVEAMRALWTQEVAEYRGHHVRIEPSWSWPKPLQPGGPPVLIGGGTGPKMISAIARYADGWMPVGGAGVRAALDDLRRECDAVGRDAGTLQIVPFGTIPNEGKLEYYREIGVTEVVLRVPGGGADTVLPVLDRFAELITR